MRTILKAAIATTLYGAVHSLLAARGTKRTVEQRFGHRHRAGLYRPFYIAQSLATFTGLALYLRRLPRRELYRVTGAPALVMRAGQGAAGLWAVLAAGSVGFTEITGLRPLTEWLRGGDPAPEPEAQGPAPGGRRGMHVTGPFRYSRHPLNLAPLLIFWLQPTMTTRLLGFSLASGAYLVLGSVHEERRLEAAYGRPYRRYLERGPSFYLPGRRRPE